VGFRYNPSTGTIDIRGYNMATSRKFRNVADNGRVAFVVDDIVSTQPWRVRCLEIRGVAEAIEDPTAALSAGLGSAIIRIHPRRIISFGLESTDVEPHRLVANRRNVVTTDNLEAEYRAAAQDTTAEQAAMDWIEAHVDEELD
jgi:pyridoxamine 5'-phosphate oxidase family protein